MNKKKHIVITDKAFQALKDESKRRYEAQDSKRSKTIGDIASDCIIFYLREYPKGLLDSIYTGAVKMTTIKGD